MFFSDSKNSATEKVCMEEKKKIRVLRIINRFNMGGPTYNATFLTRFLSDDFETLLIGGLPEEGEVDSLHIPEEYGVKPLLIQELQRDPGFSSDRKAYKRIKQIIEEFKPDIVHTHAAKAGALGRRAAFSAKVPVVVHTFHGHVFHSYFGKAKTYIFKTIERRLAKRSSGIIAISDLQKKELSLDHRICKENHVKVIPLGFDLSRFAEKRKNSRLMVRERYGLKENEVAIAIVGRLVPVKDHGFFLDAVNEVLKRTKKQIKVFIVGDGTEGEKIRQRAELINQTHGESVIMTSWIKDIAEFNAGMDIMCLTSLNEGTPVSLIEAQASGIPVISTDVGGVRDIVIEGETGHVIAKGDLEGYVQKMLELIEDEKKREIMSQNGWPFVRDKFHYERLVRDMEEYYKELLKKN
jgi:glycosyltransferase involved in cell wall biosynthesis